MVMNNMESDTDEVFIRGQSYKKVTNNLKRGVTRRDGKKGVGSSSALINGKKVDVAQFQDLLFEKSKQVQDNTDEYEEPRKPDYDIFQIVEEREHLAEMEELRRIQEEIDERRRA